MQSGKTQEEIVNELSKFQTVTSKEITCPKCTHTGIQGQISGNLFNWMTLLGVATLIIGNFSDDIGWLIWLSSPILIIVGVWKSNKFQCPSCGLESFPGVRAKINPLYKKE
jgi:hypothetical protein